MRRLVGALAAVVLVAAGLGAAATAGAMTTTTTYTPTVRVVIRPVTTTGHARSGFAVHREPNGRVDCSYPTPSPGAVNRDIEMCFPAAEYAIACWKSATPHRVLCMRDPSTKRLAKIPRVGKFAPTPRAPRAQRAPLLIVLGDGTHCSIRDGGAWSILKSHPNWVGTYSCARHGVVWAPPTAAHHGVNESNPSWTVRTAPASGIGRLVTRHIRRAYFVGTFGR